MHLAKKLLILCFLLAASPVSAQTPSETPPNVLLIMTDDQGYGDIRSHNNPKIDTPVLDRLANDGARFNQFMVSPMCAPTRAALLTGRFPLRVGVHGVTRGREAIRQDEVTLGQLFKQKGYATGIFGKWHNGEHYPYTPPGRGFDRFVGFTAGHWENYFDPHLIDGQELRPFEGYITDVLTDEALRFIEKHKDGPFFCYLPYNAPHGPWQLPDRYFDKYKSWGLDDTTASAYGMVENLDDNIGRLLDALDAHGLADNTVVIFLTDNGPNSDRYNAGMRGRKGDVHEGGVRVPLFVRWPGQIPEGRVVNQLAAHIDLLPTLQTICGLPAVDKPLDGRDLTPLLTGVESADWPDRKLLDYAWSRAGVRTERWRAIKDHTQPWELYNMQSDPGQTTDVAAEEPEVLAGLAAAFDAYKREVDYDAMYPEPTPVGLAEAARVTLPAHEAYLHKHNNDGIHYVTGAGWAGEWITRWNRLEAYPSWRISVREPGTYRVTLLYASYEPQIGSELIVEVGETRLPVKVQTAHSLRHIPANDRVRTKKTYVEGWGELSAGVITLESGEQQLRVRAGVMTGKAMPLLKAVRLERESQASDASHAERPGA